jgi:hypothetical protein
VLDVFVLWFGVETRMGGLGGGGNLTGLLGRPTSPGLQRGRQQKGQRHRHGQHVAKVNLARDSSVK